ncbi:MAG: uroporphyrinogen decarboxylase family protein [Candidatus Omnitrophica bacterium]|nr:uroporphyrinogen decarboxylase family protein [Candidatus Omnitrophota bacterium]
MERVLAALQGKESDRRAFTMTLSLYGAKLTDCPLLEYYTRPERYLEGQIEVARQCRTDIIFTPFVLPFEAQAFGSDILYLEKYPPNVRKPFIRDLVDIDKIKVPDLKNDAGLNYLRESSRLLAAHFKGTVPVCGILTSPMDLPAIIMGVDNWLEILLFDKAKARAVTAVMSAYFVAMANSLFDAGVDFLGMAMVFSNPKILFEKTVVDVIVPALADIFAQLKGPVVFHHGSLPIAGYLPLYRNLPNVAGFLLDQRDDLSKARQIAGENVLLLGNLEGPTLAKVGTARALEKAQRILENRKDDRHFILATSSADVAWDTPLETITGIYDLVRRYEASHAG